MIYLLCLLSGAAALVYQVVWVRALTLVFGGSHQAVTVVLAIFMAGLALGGYAFGRAADRAERPLRLYGFLELGVALSALLFKGLMAIYPLLYVPVAAGRDDATLYLAAVRTLFSAVALALPTVLMGGTLPILSRVVARQPEALRKSLALLYGLNTLGAVLGTALAGFVLLRLYGVGVSLYLAVSTNALVGLVALLMKEGASVLPASAAVAHAAPEPAREPAPAATAARPGAPPAGGEDGDVFRDRLVLWGIGVSGFCALGYEVLWTRVLTLFVGASVYSFTLMLAAFLAGIALGSHAYGLVAARTGGSTGSPPTRAVVGFGIVQVAIGVTALLVTLLLRDVAVGAVRLQRLLLGSGLGSFPVRVWSGFALAFLYMAVPAFLMGVAFPLAGEVHARSRRAVGRAVGEVFAFNTAGAVLGAGIAGFVLIRLLGIERSLEALALLNAGTGLAVLAALGPSRRRVAAVGAGLLGALAILIASPASVRLWDTSYLAIYRSNQPEAFRTPEMVREAVENTEVLYYAEGVDSIVSVIRVRGGEQSFLTNGRVEASSHLQAQQAQLLLGHLPMLLAQSPRRVLVVGMGSGMTLGAVSVHPGIEQLTVAEIEPKVVGVARAFAAYNHRVLDHPRLRLLFNDGRNFLATTPERFDVITADPIHPWFRGAGYLYTTEYFELVARRLSPGGVVAQWLPIYELTPADLRSIVRTFQAQFRHTLLWLTHVDAELIGSNAPLPIDEGELARRMAEPAIAADLGRVTMGSAADLLGYFVMGTDGMARFAQGGVLNTDDRLHLEFSAPLSIATPSVMEANVRALSAGRESILPYLAPAAGPAVEEARRRREDRQREASRIGDVALALFLGGKTDHPDFERALAGLAAHHPDYAPGRALAAEYRATRALEPRPLDSTRLALVSDRGQQVAVELVAVLVPVSSKRAALMVVDNRARVVYGQRYVDDYEESERVTGLVAEVMAAIQTAYRREAALAAARRNEPPREAETMRQVRAAIEAKLGRPGVRTP